MGRRRRHHSDDDDDALEREWLKKRQKCESEDSSRSKEAPSGEAVHPNNVGTEVSPSPAAKKDGTSNNDADKIERQRLKKQLKKQRQKEKRAEAAKQADLARQKKEKEKLQLQKMQKEQAAKKNEKKKFNDSSKQGNNEFKSLRKGVKFLDLKVGKGPVVQHRKKLRIAYTLRAKNHMNGKIIDASKNFGFRLGKGEVIEGYDIGLEGMRVGGIRRLIVPKQAGYHNDDIGAGRGADLFFEIELLYVAP